MEVSTKDLNAINVQGSVFAKGRKLTEADKEYIRNSSMSASGLAVKFNCTEATIKWWQLRDDEREAQKAKKRHYEKTHPVQVDKEKVATSRKELKDLKTKILKGEITEEDVLKEREEKEKENIRREKEKEFAEWAWDKSLIFEGSYIKISDDSELNAKITQNIKQCGYEYRVVCNHFQVIAR